MLRPIVQPLLSPIVRQLRDIGLGFSPRLLFASGEQGFLYINDISTMYQDSAGTIPAVLEQPVGKWLDQSGRGNHATQPTSANRPTLKQDAKGNYYVHFNGTNQWMQTGSVDFTGTNKMTVFAGVTKLSDAAGGMLLNHEPNVTLAPAFFLTAPEGASSSYGARAAGTATYTAKTPASYASPRSDVVSLALDNAGASLDATFKFRVSGQASLPLSVVGGTTAGGGGFASGVAYIGKRNGDTLFFNGDIYCLSARGAATNDTLIAQAERWINGRMGGVF